MPQLAQRSREVGRHGGFADSALAAPYGDNMTNTLDPDPAGLFTQLGFEFVGLELDLPDSEFMGDLTMDLGRKLLHHFFALGRLPDSQRYSALRRDRNVLDQPQLYDIVRVAGIFHPAERFDYGINAYLPCHRGELSQMTGALESRVAIRRDIGPDRFAPNASDY